MLYWTGKEDYYYPENSLSIETIGMSDNYSDRFEREQSVSQESMPPIEFEYDE